MFLLSLGLMLTGIVSVSANCQSYHYDQSSDSIAADNTTWKPDDAGNQIAVEEMCFYCFEVLDNILHDINAPIVANFTNDKHPLFVTWEKGENKSLRGCMGTFNPSNLHSDLREYAINSAFHDYRFLPINIDELEDLFVSVSILTHFETARDYLDWTLDVHGIRIECVDELGYVQRATYLPDVARKHGWDQIQTIDSLLRKCGFRQEITPEIRQDTKLKRYRSEKKEMSYPEYHRLKTLNRSPSVESLN